jgi:hypothetical protein
MEFKDNGVHYPTHKGCTNFTHFFLIRSLRLKTKVEQLMDSVSSPGTPTFVLGRKNRSRVLAQIRVLKSQYINQSKSPHRRCNDGN